jgi:uncharacterized glyoxalase superfamily protein PhnB
MSEQPVKRQEKVKFTKLSPIFQVDNVKAAVQFYQDILGFNIEMAVPMGECACEQQLSADKEYIWASVSRDNVELMLQESANFRADMELLQTATIGASVSFYIEIEGLDELFRQVKSKGVTSTDIKTTRYGMREFYVRDLNGYVLGFADKLG